MTAAGTTNFPTGRPPIRRRSYQGMTSRRITTAARSAVDFQTPNTAIAIRPMPIQTTALTARLVSFDCASHRSCERPTAPSAAHHQLEIVARIRRRTSAAFRCPLAEKALGAKDEDQDEYREHDRLRPVAPRHVPRQAVVVRLDESDHQCAEDRARQVADAAEDSRGERDQAELEAGVVANFVEVERVRQPAG